MSIWQVSRRVATFGVILSASALATFVPGRSEAQPRDEAKWERLYCEGMQEQVHLDSGGFVDCLSPEFAIEMDWSDKWAEAVGQSLYYAYAKSRKPGIILLCEESEGPEEGLCRSDVYRLEFALKSVSVPVKVWTCAVNIDLSLEDCFQPELQ